MRRISGGGAASPKNEKGSVSVKSTTPGAMAVRTSVDTSGPSTPIESPTGPGSWSNPRQPGGCNGDVMQLFAEPPVNQVSSPSLLLAAIVPASWVPC